MDMHLTLGLAVNNLRRNRLRTVLSLLGIMIGVFSVTLIVSLGFGLKGYIIGLVEQFGKNYVTINAKVPELSMRGSIQAQVTGGEVVSIDTDDMEALKDIPHVKAVVGFQSDAGFAVYRNQEVRTFVFGASPEYPEFDLQTKLAKGRFYSERDNKSLAPVVVLGSEIAERLFGDRDPIGEKIRFKNLSLEVIGVTEPRGALAGFDFDTLMFVPLELMAKRISGSDFVMEIDVLVSSSEHVEQTALEIERVLRREHGIKDPAKDDFTITTSEEAIGVIGTVTNAITILLGLLAAVSLLVGGIGIMNIMLVSVTERIREVGLRKALGARNSSIRNQFLMEAVLLTTFGGMLGGGFGTLMTLAIIAYARYTGFDVAYSVSLLSLTGAIAVAMIVGVVFGIYPARKAARLDPITALKYE